MLLYHDNVNFYISCTECYHENGESYRGYMANTDIGTPCISWEYNAVNQKTHPNKVMFFLTALCEERLFEILLAYELFVKTCKLSAKFHFI